MTTTVAKLIDYIEFVCTFCKLHIREQHTSVYDVCIDWRSFGHWLVFVEVNYKANLSLQKWKISKLWRFCMLINRCNNWGCLFVWNINYSDFLYSSKIPQGCYLFKCVCVWTNCLIIHVRSILISYEQRSAKIRA